MGRNVVISKILAPIRRMKRLTHGLLIGGVTALCGLGLAMTPLGTTFERTFGLDWLFTVRGAIKPPPEVVVVAIDSTTGRALGQPKLPRDWPRTVHADLVK